MKNDHKHTHSRDGAGLRRLRAEQRYIETRLETLRLQQRALNEARARIEKQRSKQ